MNLTVFYIAIPLSALFFYLGWLIHDKLRTERLAKARLTAESILEEAKQEAENLKKEKLLEAEEQIFQMRQALEQQEKEKQAKFKKLEHHLSLKETNLDRKVDILNKKERGLRNLDEKLQAKRRQLDKKEQELDRLVHEQNQRLAQISGITSEDAKKIQLENILEQAREEAESLVEEIVEKAKLTAQQRSRDVIVQAIQRASVGHIAETTVSLVQLPNDDMKGRIIGREGRNIRTFEAVTGIEVLIDDTPEVVMLSGFDPVRREVAKLALEKLITDGRIHPGRIEEVVEKSREEIEEKFYEHGEQAVLEVGLHGVHSDLIKLLGKLRYHTAQGQNLLQHCVEVAAIAGLMASELELDTVAAKRAGLLHEIGMAIENYTMGTSSELSAELAKKHGESEIVQEAILHANTQVVSDTMLSPIAILVNTANEISMLRPGAQKESLENYFTRLRTLEESANSFVGVAKAYAIQAGRELRVIVEHSEVDDSKAEQLAAEISRKIKNSMTYPGQVRVTVVREYRTSDYAK